MGMYNTHTSIWYTLNHEDSQTCSQKGMHEETNIFWIDPFQYKTIAFYRKNPETHYS